MKIAGTLLSCDLAKREISYRILPFGEAGSTNLGKVTASAGTVEIPANPGDVTFNEEHDYTKPLGRAIAITETATGLDATFKIANTSRGDDVLIEASEGLRTGASVEISNPVIRNGRLVSGLLDAVAAVVRPAFPSAQIQMVAADCGELPPNNQEDTMADQQPQATSTVAEPAPADTQATEATAAPLAAAQAPQQANPAMVAAQAPAGVHAPKLGNAGAKVGPTLDEFAKMVAGMHNEGQGTNQMLAALTTVTQANIFDVASVPQYVGEVYSGRGYTRKFAPLINHADLTNMKVIGFRFDSEPTPTDWAGSTAAVPSGTVSVEEVEETAARIAGGWAVDRIHRDFPNPAWWAGYLRTSAKNYDKKVDSKVPAALIAAAGSTPGTADGVGAAASGVSNGAHLIIEGAMSIVDEALPTFVLLDTATYKSFMKTRSQDELAYIKTQLGFDAGDTLGIRIVPCSDLGTGEALVGAGEAATLYELGGAAPIRVEAEGLTNGTIDMAVFGYWAVLIEDPSALAYVNLT